MPNRTQVLDRVNYMQLFCSRQSVNYAHTDHKYQFLKCNKMAKKRNYENDEAFKNFRLEDYLPSMPKREPEAETYVPEQEAVTEDIAPLPSPDEPDRSVVQAAVSDADRQDEPKVWEDEADGAGEEAEAAVPVPGVSTERTTVRRISSKQRRLSLEEYRATYLQVPRITDRKPVFLSSEVRDRLDEVVRRLGGRGMSVSGLVENLARLHLEAYKDDIEQWRRL